MNNFKFQLEHIFTFGALLQSPEVIGPVAEGIKVNFYALGGEMTGPKMNGKCRAVGGDWLTLRTDGVAILDVRTTLETNDGALISINYTGVGDLGPDGHNLFLEGKLPPPFGAAGGTQVPDCTPRLSLAKPVTMPGNWRS